MSGPYRPPLRVGTRAPGRAPNGQGLPGRQKGRCVECAHHDSAVGIARTDLGRAARTASRYRDPSPRILAAINELKAEVASRSELREAHIADCPDAS